MGKPLVKENTDDKDSFVDELKPGTKLMHGQYTIESFLNAGGFGITYLARDSLDRKIVIKECFPGAFCRRSRYVVQARSRAHQNELKSIVRLFVQEARSLAKLDHPNIVGVHQVFEDNETAYMALDFIEGRDLLDTIEDPNHGLTPKQIKVILKEVLGAVGFIHDQGILHRDISPDNILINKQFHPVLIDFGAAREQATKQTRVLSALRVVKDGYSPQEFYIAGSNQSPSSDLYALAASFYHLISKEVPPNSQARLAAIASSEPDPYKPLVGRTKEYDENFLAAIDKALAVLPKDRLQSAREWLDMMDGDYGNVTPLNVAPPFMDRANPSAVAQPAQKSKLPLLLGTGAVLALLVGAGVMMMSGGQDAPTVAVTPADPAPVETAAAQQAGPAPTVSDAPLAPPTPDRIVAEPVTVPVIIDEAPALAEQQARAANGTETAPAIVESEADSAEIAALTELVEPTLPEPPLPEPVATPRPPVVAPAANADFPYQTTNRPILDTEIADVAFPATSDLIAAVGAGPSVDIPTVMLGNELPPPNIASNWTVRLPFAPAEPHSNAIGAVGEISPVWAWPGLEITSVNGTEIDTIAQIPATLRAAQPAIPTDTLQVTFGTRDPASGETIERAWVMPVMQETELLNGIRFETAFAGSNWRTSVVAIPEGVTTDLQIGDVVTSFIPTAENITERYTLGRLIERELNNGTAQFMFAVLREGSMWVASMTIERQD